MTALSVCRVTLPDAKQVQLTHTGTPRAAASRDGKSVAQSFKKKKKNEVRRRRCFDSAVCFRQPRSRGRWRVGVMNVADGQEERSWGNDATSVFFQESQACLVGVMATREIRGQVARKHASQRENFMRRRCRRASVVARAVSHQRKRRNSTRRGRLSLMTAL